MRVLLLDRSLKGDHQASELLQDGSRHDNPARLRPAFGRHLWYGALISFSTLEPSLFRFDVAHARQDNAPEPNLLLVTAQTTYFWGFAPSSPTTVLLLGSLFPGQTC
jgi:hypothetical protein